jgi:hypothetical protein
MPCAYHSSETDKQCICNTNIFLMPQTAVITSQHTEGRRTNSTFLGYESIKRGERQPPSARNCCSSDYIILVAWEPINYSPSGIQLHLRQRPLHLHMLDAVSGLTVHKFKTSTKFGMDG